MITRAPSPIAFSLDVAQCARIRRDFSRAAGERFLLVSGSLLSLMGLGNAASSARLDGWHDPFVWVQIVFWSAYVPLCGWRAFGRSKVRPETGTIVTFDETGLFIRRGAASLDVRVPFRRIRSVMFTPTAVAIYGIWKPYVVIPLEAVPDGGTHVLRFFEEHIVSQGMPQHSCHGVTTIANSVWPLFARG